MTENPPTPSGFEHCSGWVVACFQGFRGTDKHPNPTLSTAKSEASVLVKQLNQDGVEIGKRGEEDHPTTTFSFSAQPFIYACSSYLVETSHLLHHVHAAYIHIDTAHAHSNTRRNTHACTVPQTSSKTDTHKNILIVI